MHYVRVWRRTLRRQNETVRMHYAGCLGEHCIDKRRRSGCTTQEFGEGHCHGKMRQSGCTTYGFGGGRCIGKTRQLGPTMHGFGGGHYVRKTRQSGRTMHGYCGVVGCSDNLEIIWR